VLCVQRHNQSITTGLALLVIWDHSWKKQILEVLAGTIYAA